MNILQLFDMAGVGAILGNEFKKMGHSSISLQLKQLDPFGFGEYYGNTLYFDDLASLMNMKERVIYESDVVILHDYCEILPELEEKPVFMVYHGSKLRENRGKPLDDRRAKKVFVTTDDLLAFKPDASLLDVPVDLDLFKNQHQSVRFGTLIMNRGRDRKYIENLLQQNGFFGYDYYDRQKDGIIPYNKMPDFLNKYDNYLDFKFDYARPTPNLLPRPSLTGLQALACGLRVFGPSGMLDKELLLSKHNSVVVARKCLQEVQKNQPK